ncbi:BTAD domain-containing putative transcriptional regulator [Kocuria sediminis]|nr:BTAD domain-containing putative transcriptional regulator [Kocuria sediminis]
MMSTDNGRALCGPPQAEGLVRERLLRRIDPVLSARLGVVVAPHGTGKTTLLAHWAARRQARLVWHRVDPADAQPERLMAGLARSVAALVRSPEPCSTAELASLAEADGRPLFIVLDDVHLIVGTAAETELERLLLLCPPNVHLVVAGRLVPSFNLARPEFSTVVLVAGEDLRFRADEAHALLQDVHGLRIDPLRTLDLVRATDGWAAAVHLFHLHAMRCSPVERHRAACDTAAHYAWDHLRRHVLGDLTAHEAELLGVASMLDLVTPRHCDALLGPSGAAEAVLPKLVQRSLLVVDDTEPGLRMPCVLRRYFTDELRKSMDSTRYAALRGRAVALLEYDGFLANALRLLATDGRWAEARQLLARSGAEAFVPGACAWAELLPPGLVGTDPWFALAEARRLYDDGQLARAHAVACRALALADDAECTAIATELRSRSSAWGSISEGPLPGGGAGAEPPLRAATRGSPAVVARSLCADSPEEDLLAAGVASVLAGDRRTALPPLRRCAELLDKDRPAALAAQLVLALFETEEICTAPDTTAAEIEAVQRHAWLAGLSWLARLADGMLAILSGSTAGEEIADAVARDCERRGDAWGAALLHSVALLACVSSGVPEREGYRALAAEFRALGADVLASWALSRAASPLRADAVASAAEMLDKPFVGARPTLCDTRLDSTDRKSAAGCLRGRASEGSGIPSLAVTCFGGLTVHLDGALVDLTAVRPRARTVLRLLVLNAGRPVHREQLASTLWADLDEQRAQHNLQVSISALRHVLDLQGTGDGRRAILRQDDSYVLIVGPGSWSDLAEFDRLLQEADRYHRRRAPARAVAALQSAVDLYTDDVFPEEGPAEWVLVTRDRYRLRAARAAGALARTSWSLGQEQQAVGAAARSVEINPWSDESWRLLIALLRDSGEVAEAERTRRRYCDMLASLGIDSGTGPGGGEDRDHVRPA